MTKVWQKRGIFIEGINVFAKGSDNEPIFMYKSPEDKVLAFGYTTKFEQKYEKLEIGQKIRAFLEINEDNMPESSVTEMNITPAGFYLEKENSGLYLSAAIQIHGTNKRFGSKNVFVFKSPETRKFIELRYADPSLASTLKPNQPIDAYVQLDKDLKDSEVISIDHSPEGYTTAHELIYSTNSANTNHEMTEILIKNVPSVQDFLREERERIEKVKSKTEKSQDLPRKREQEQERLN